MLEILTWIGIFIVSLFVLIKASDYFTDAAETLGLFFKMPPFIIGVTIVALGTSLPELVSSLFAVFRGAPEIVVGNVVGSNIANIFLVLGIAAIVAKNLKITYELIHVDLPLLISSAFFLVITLWDGMFTFPEAILALAGIIIYLWYTVTTGKEHPTKETKKELKEIAKKRKLNSSTILTLIISMVFIYFGARYTIESVIALSTMLNIGTEIIAVSAIALGTSLPELAVSITAARKGKPEICLGNVLGSSIFNTFLVMGIPGLFATLPVPSAILTFSLPFMVIATLLFFFMSQAKEVTRWEGWMLLIFYVLFIGKLFGWL